MQNETEISVKTIANAIALTHGILHQVLGDAASTHVDGQDIENDTTSSTLVAVAIQSSLAEHLG